MRIVIISPFSHKDPDVRRYRVREARGYAEHLGKAGHYAIALIGDAEEVFAVTGRMDFEHYQEVNDSLILSADQVHLLKLSGYEFSRGVAHELRLATEAGKRVLWVDPRRGGYWLAGTQMLVLEAIAQEVEA